MGKNYAESSLKHYLKQKVRITLGLVVTFLITGAVAFAEGTDNREQEHKDKITGIENTVENLAGLGKGEISAGVNNQYIVVEKTADKTIIKKADDKSIIAEIDNSFISTKTAGTVSNTLQNMDGTNGNGVNKGIKGEKQGLASNGIICNKGIIKFQGNTAQDISGGATAYNYGIIANDGQYGQYGRDKNENNVVYNYGIIANSGQYGQKLSVGTADNYGIIVNSNNYGQIADKGTVNNYGIIANKGTNGQQVSAGTAINYGIIKNYGEKGQIGGAGAVIYNYGIIANTGNYGQYLETSLEKAAYNYGLIANSGDYAIRNVGMGIAENYGVVKNSTGKVFENNVNNYGIVILTNKELQDGGLGTGENRRK